MLEYTEAQWQEALSLLKRGIEDALRIYGIQYTTAADAPDTWERLKAETPDPRNLVIWDGASESAIWDAQSNYAYRAWHDWSHLMLGASFTFHGERNTAEYQVSLLRGIIGSTSAVQRLALAIFWAESWGQVAHVKVHGEFPRNQEAFTRAYVRLGDAALDTDTVY